MSEVKLSDRTIQLFKKLNMINQSLLIKSGEESEVRTINEGKSFAGYCAIEESLPQDFCVYDLGEFLSVYGIVNDPVLTFDDAFISISSGDGSQRLRFHMTEESLVDSYFEKDISLDSEDIVIEVPEDAINTATKVSRTMRLEFAGLRGDGENVSIVAFNRRTGSDDAETNSFSHKIGATSEVFDVFFPSENLRNLDGAARFALEIDEPRISVECGDMKYIMSIEEESTFGQ